MDYHQAKFLSQLKLQGLPNAQINPETGQEFKYGNDFYLDHHYNSPKIHKNMINDKVRTTGYRNAILKSQCHIKDKIIMDIGCGTGILSLFAVEAGAKRVIAVESVPKIAQCAKKIMVLNKVDHIVTVVEGKLEDLTELPDKIQKVDVIISEYLGYSIFVESMLETIVFGRDKWLKPGGIIMPDELTLNIYAFQHKILWDNMHNSWERAGNPDHEPGLNFIYSSIRDYAKGSHFIADLKEKNMITDGVKLVKIDMNTISLAQLQEMSMSFTIFPTQNETTVTIGHGLATYFEATFSKMFVDPLTITNAPWYQQSHWLNTVFLFDKEWRIAKGSALKGNFKVCKHPNYPRDVLFTIKLEYIESNKIDLGWFKLSKTYIKSP